MTSLPGLVRARAERAFVRSHTARRALLLAYAHRVHGRRYDLDHLSVFAEEDAYGPVQRDEALLLFGLTRVLRPRTVVEFGFLYGRSAMNFLEAMPSDSHLYAFDITDEAATVAREMFAGLPRFTFRRVSQADIAPEHVDERPIDLALLDASHDLELNQRTWEQLAPLLAPQGIVVVHDTGTWHRKDFRAVHRAFAEEHGPEGWLSEDEYQHQVDERRFVNWVLDGGEYDVVHLHTTTALRHGMTLLQRRARLPTG